ERYQPDDAAAAAAGLRESVTELGGARVGDKTMVDALIPFTDTFSEAVSAGESINTALSRAAERAHEAAEQTASLSPKLGRARPLAERSVGHPDPGAVSFALVVNAVADNFESMRDGNGERK
ncbi:MAG TPA: DAK2 domain-containing protein, partial [Microbacteriaceae bacterium]